MNSKAILIFGQITPGEFPVVRNVSLGFEAYEKYQCVAYLPEIIDIRKKPGFVEHRKLFPQIAKIAQLISADEFFELGSTLFASIDKFAKCVGDQQSQSINFVGIEPSKLFRETAEILHPNHRLTHYASSGLAHIPNIAKSVHRSYQASSYAFGSVGELVNWITRFGASQDGIWFSMDDKDMVTHFLGSRVVTFSFSQYCKAMRNAGYKLQILTAQEVKHHGFSFIEIFSTAYRHEIADINLIDWDSNTHCDFEESATTIADIPKECWLEARSVPVITTSLSDALMHGRALNFAGLHSNLTSNG